MARRVFAASGSLSAGVFAANVATPTIDQSLSMKSVSGAQISPDGRYVAYVVTADQLGGERFRRSRSGSRSTATGERYQLTSGKKSSSGPQWSPDSRRLAFVSDRDGKRQIYLIAPGGGEAAQLTTEENGVGAHRLVARRHRDRVHVVRRRMPRRRRTARRSTATSKSSAATTR